MAELEIAGDMLVVHIRGVDKVLALASRLEISLRHISSVEIDPAEAHQVFQGLRMGGTNVPRVITAGRFLEGGEWAFWDMHDPSQSIVIYLHDDSYARLVIGVDDPRAAVATIRKALDLS